MVSLPEQILAVLKEGLSAWKTFIATRQEAYNRSKDKKQEKAIQIAEEAFTKVSVLYEFINENMVVPENKKAEFDRIKILIYRLRDKFNKYD